MAKLGRPEDAITVFDEALQYTSNEKEKKHIENARFKQFLILNPDQVRSIDMGLFLRSEYPWSEHTENLEFLGHGLTGFKGRKISIPSLVIEEGGPENYPH